MRGYGEFEEIQNLCNATLKKLISEKYISDNEYADYRHEIMRARDIRDLEDIKNALETEFRKAIEEKNEEKKEEPVYNMPTPEEIEEENKYVKMNPNLAKFDVDYKPADTVKKENETAGIAAGQKAEEFFADPTNAKNLNDLRNNYLDGKIDKETYDNLVKAYFNEWIYRTENDVISDEGPRLR